MNTECHLRTQLARLTRSLRRTEPGVAGNSSVPLLAEDDIFFFEGQHLSRRRILLRCRGCSVGTCTMCPLPNESLSSRQQLPTDEDLQKQVSRAFSEKPLGDYDVVNIYTNGNFFCDAEISPAFRRHIYALVGQSDSRFLMVESLPHFLTEEELAEAAELLRGRTLIVCMGLESASDTVRRLCINTACSKESFEQAVRLLRQYGHLPRVFLMLKPPFLTESEAIEDAVSSIHYLRTMGITDPTLCPARTAPGTVAGLLASRGEFREPSLWSILEVIRRTHEWSNTRIAVSNIMPDRNASSITPSGCPVCSDRMIEALCRYNTNRSLQDLVQIACDCKKQYEMRLAMEDSSIAGMPIELRVGQFLSSLAFSRTQSEASFMEESR